MNRGAAVSDTDPASMTQWLLSLLGFSGGAGAVAKTVLAHKATEVRLKKLEEDRDNHSQKIDAIHERTARLDERTIHISEDVKEILRTIRRQNEDA